jgi:hypothetical protein
MKMDFRFGVAVVDLFKMTFKTALTVLFVRADVWQGDRKLARTIQK